jgi:hypothetical protein
MCDCDASFVIVSLYHINSEQLTDRGSILILNPYLAKVVYVKRSEGAAAAAEKKEVLSFKKMLNIHIKPFLYFLLMHEYFSPFNSSLYRRFFLSFSSVSV